MKAHPAAELFPMMSDAELDDLAADIKENGLQNAIIVHEGMVLDGRNRLAACMRAEIAPRQETWNGSGATPLRFVVSANLHRRHLTTSQRAAVAVEIRPMIADEVDAALRAQRAAAVRDQPRESAGSFAPHAADFSSVRTQPDPLPTGAGYSSTIAGDLMGVGPSTVREAQQVKDADPDLFEEVKRGDIKVGSAVNAVRKKKAESTPRGMAKTEKLDEVLTAITKLSRSWNEHALFGVGASKADSLARRLDAAIELLQTIRSEVEPLRSRVTI